MAGFFPAYALLISVVLLLGGITPLFAAEPVTVEVTGVEGEPLKNVQEALALPYGLVQDGNVDRHWFDRFAKQAGEKARNALEPYGYYHALVTATVAEVQKGKYRLLVAVIPGTPVRLTQVDVLLLGPGADEAALRRLATEFPLDKGDIMLQPDYERAKNRLKASAVDLGYLDADFTRHEIRITRDAINASIGLTLQTGQRYYFGDVRIEGAPDYPQLYLKRFVTFQAGDVYSSAKLGETQLNFSNSERFKEVLITPEKQQAMATRVPVLVKLTAAPSRTLRPGVGYGTDTGARFTVHYRDMNLFHEGQDLNLKLYLAERLQGFAALYSRPSPQDIKSSTSVQLNLQREDVTTYVSSLAALELARNRSFGQGELGTAYLRLQQENFTIAGETSSSRLVLPGVRFMKEHYDNMIRPTSGYRYSLDLRGAHRYIGSDSSLVQLITVGNILVPMPARLTLNLRGKAGASLLADPLGELPPSIRFFAGGDQSVRGYSYQSLGPRGATGEVVGGKHLLFGSVELERAIFKNWGVSLFYDTGNAFNDFKDFQLYQGAGIGAHYYTPVGGLNFSLARQLGTSGNSYHIHFTVGFQL